MTDWRAVLAWVTMVVAAVVAAPGSAAAQARVPAPPADGPDIEEPVVSGVFLVHDNDNLPHPGNTLRDDNYSAGYELRVNGRGVVAAHLTAPLAALDRVTGMNGRHGRSSRTFHSAQLTGLLYTPDRIDTGQVQEDDRPYASLLALTVGRTSVTGASLDRVWWSQFSIGMLGLAAPGDLQGVLHRTRRWMTGKHVPVDPQGWPNQISAGGEPTALYRTGYERRLGGDGAVGRRKHWEVVGALEGSAGYHTTAAASLSARLGAFTSEFWESPRGITSPAVGQHDPPGDVRRWDLFAFGLLRPRVVAYNALVQGQFRTSVHTVAPRRLLGEWEGGLGASMPWGGAQLQVVVHLAQGRTADFAGAKARDYTWGTVGLFFSRPMARRHDR